MTPTGSALDDGHHHAVLADLRQPTRELRHVAPGPWRGFAEHHDAAMSAGALPVRTKELIALAIAIAQRCDGCTATPETSPGVYGEAAALLQRPVEAGR